MAVGRASGGTRTGDGVALRTVGPLQADWPGARPVVRGAPATVTGLILELVPPGLLGVAVVGWVLPYRLLPFGLAVCVALVLWTFMTPAARAAPVAWHLAIIGLLVIVLISS